MRRFGTNYGGWSLPTEAKLNPTSIIYSAGVGEDISFDLLLQETYDCTIILLDPTERAKKHYEEVQAFYATGVPRFTGDIQRDYLSTISSAKPDFSMFTYVPQGLWSTKDMLKFYKPVNPQYVSHTLIPNLYSDQYTEVPVDSVKHLMGELGHSSIDLLKLDIEGAELAVLDQMLNDGVFPRYLCVEFDLKLKGADPESLTESMLARLRRNGYRLLENREWNCTFEHSGGTLTGGQ
jgi:hypothetical protein